MYRKFNRYVNEINERINEKRYESESNKLLRGQKEWDEATAIFVDNMDILDQHNAHLKYDLIVKQILVISEEIHKYRNNERKFAIHKQHID